MGRNLVGYVGGLEASLEALGVMRQHKICCGEHEWDMLDVYGKGRASRKVVDRKLEALVSYDSKTSFSLEELEKAVEQELLKNLTTIGGMFKVVYNEPTVLPKRLFGASLSDYWDISPTLIIRYKHRGEVKFVTGHYRFNNCTEGKDSFHLDGHGGDWDQYVTGWAYV